MTNALVRRGVWLAVAVTAVHGSLAFAQDYKPLAALLTDLPGWQAEPADGSALAAQGMRIVQAERVYRQKGKRTSVQLMLGPRGMAGNADIVMDFETEDLRTKASKVDGFDVMTTYTKPAKEGVVTVGLVRQPKNDGVLLMEFSGLSDEEALALAKKFDWSAMRKAIERLAAD